MNLEPVLEGTELLFAYAFATLIGLLIGSFYTATASRVLYYFYGPGRKDERRWRLFLSRPSFCFACEEPISRFYLLPIFGFIFSRGRCVRCGARISWQTLAGELAPGLILPLLLARGWAWPVALFTVLLWGQLYMTIATDYFFYAIDYENTALIALWAGLAAAFGSGLNPDEFWPHAMTGVGALMIFGILFVLARGRGLGAGDIPLAGALGLYFGWPWSLVLFQIAAAGSIVYILIILKDRRSPAPFGVFLAGAAYLTLVLELFVGELRLDWFALFGRF